MFARSGGGDGGDTVNGDWGNTVALLGLDRTVLVDCGRD